MKSKMVGEQGMSTRHWTRDVILILGQYTIQWMLILAVIVLGLVNARFRTIANIQNILLQSSFIGIGAAGMTVIIINRSFDLSVAGILALSGIAIAELGPRIGMVAATVVALCIGAALGAFNGLVVTKLRIPAFITTLGTMNIYLAMALIWTKGLVIVVESTTLRHLGIGKLAGIPIAFLVMIVVYIICYGILRFTTYGRYISAIGSNEIAGQVAGLPVDRVKIFAFILVGFCTAIAGIMLAGLLSSANAIMATGYELRVIAAVLVGGTSLSGGRGTLIGSLTGALFFSVINNALNMFGVEAYWQYVAVGLIIVTALAIEAARQRLISSVSPT